MTTPISPSTAASTAQAVLNHDFASLGDGYAVLRAAKQVMRGGRIEQMSALIDGLHARLGQLERLRELRLQQRLQEGRLLANPDGQVLGMQFPGELAALQTDLASVGLSVQVQRWQYFSIQEDGSPDPLSSGFMPSEQVPLFINGLFNTYGARELPGDAHMQRYGLVAAVNGDPVRLEVRVGTLVVQAIPTAEIFRLQGAVQAYAARLMADAQTSTSALAARQQGLVADWRVGDEIDEYQQERIRRLLLGLSDAF